MMVIGANTPPMIKAMTAEVESKNLIVASIHPYVESSRARLLPPQPCGPRLPLHLPRADSLSHYTLDAMTGNAPHHRLVPATAKNERRQAASLPGRRFQIFDRRREASPTSCEGLQGTRHPIYFPNYLLWLTLAKTISLNALCAPCKQPTKSSTLAQCR
jgi:hypothetical protein